MFWNYFLAAVRSFKRNALTSWLNVIGLALSLAACLVIFLYIKRELSYDTGHRDAERIYRLRQTIDSGGHIERSSSCPFPALPALYQDNSHLIASYVRIFDFQLPVKSFKLEDGQLFNERHVYYADSNLFTFWDIPLLQGDPERVLDRPFTIVISERLAHKYFEDRDPVGEVILLAGQDQLRCEITGVMGKGGPSHFAPEAVISISTIRTIAPNLHKNWVWNPAWSYIKLAEGVQPAGLEARFPDFIQKYYPDFTKNMNSHQLQPIADIHLKSDLEFEMSANSDMRYIYIFTTCGILLLLIACINFINLCTVSLSSRTREVGIRKVVGASRWQLVMQILTESVATSLFAALLAIAIIIAGQPLLNRYLELNIDLNSWLNPSMLIAIFAGVVIIGLLSGLYPAIRFSEASVIGVLRANTQHGRPRNWFRKALVVVQFSIASLLIVFTLVSKRQLDFIRDKDKGYNTENILILDIMTTPIPGRIDAFKTALKQHKDIRHATIMNDLLGIGNNNHEFNHEGMPPGEWKYFPALCVDEEFISTFGIDLVAGRDYDTLRGREDSLSLVINSSMAGVLGYTPETAVGKRLYSMTGKEQIIGVTDDFHFKSLHHPVGPFVLDIAERPGHFFMFCKHMAVKVDRLSPEVLAHMESVWKEFVQNKPFEYAVLDEEIKKLYGGEDRLSRLLGIFSILSVLIACMGLFALTWFIARIKTREIAIRKTMGAGMPHLVAVATREQLLTVMISFCLGFPLAFWVINRWLQSFAFRVDQGVGPYLVSALSALAIAFFTMVFIALRTAQRNPAMVLKTE